MFSLNIVLESSGLENFGSETKGGAGKKFLKGGGLNTKGGTSFKREGLGNLR